jgi:hypothetical protein
MSSDALVDEVVPGIVHPHTHSRTVLILAKRVDGPEFDGNGKADSQGQVRAGGAPALRVAQAARLSPILVCAWPLLATASARPIEQAGRLRYGVTTLCSDCVLVFSRMGVRLKRLP